MTSNVASDSDVVRRRYFMELHNLYYQAAPNFLRKVFCEMWETINGSKLLETKLLMEEDKANGKLLSGLKALQGVFKNGKLALQNWVGIKIYSSLRLIE